MKINFKLVNPGGNITALVTDKVFRKQQVSIARKILKKFTECEQVGFIERASNPRAACRLQMAGGEICGNALRCLAYYLAMGKGKSNTFCVQSSGTTKLVMIRAKVNPQDVVYWSEINSSMPSFRKIFKQTINFNPAIKVIMQGITFYLIEMDYFPLKINLKEMFEKLLKNDLAQTDAYGLVYYKKLKRNNFVIKPIVYVPKVGSLVAETSCASGSIALLAGLQLERGLIRQPSGSLLSVNIDAQKKVANVGGEILGLSNECIET